MGDCSSLTATAVSRITQFLLNFIGKYCYGGRIFRETFATEADWRTITWNNKEIKVDSKPVYYQNYFNARVIFTLDLLFNLNSTDSYNQVSKKLGKTNISEWAGLHRSIISKKQ